MNANARKMAIALAVLVLFAAGVIGLQSFLARGIGEIIRSRAIPAMKERLNMELAFDKVGVNLLAGDLTFHGVRVANPPEFDADMIYFRRGSLKAGAWSLFRGDADILRARIKDGQLNVIRNADGRLNIGEAAALFQPAHGDPPHSGADSDAESRNESSSLPDFRLRDLAASFRLRYMDRALLDQPAAFSASVNLTVKNLANHGSPGQLSGAVAARGRIVENGSGSFHLQGLVSPITNPAAMSFVVSVKIEDVALDFLQALSEEKGLKHESVSGALNLKCDGGVFDPDKSELRLTFRDIRFAGDMARKTMGLEGLESLTVSAPIGGDLASGPDVDIESAIRKSMMSDEVLRQVAEGIEKRQAGTTGEPESPGSDAGDDLEGKKLKRSRDFDLHEMIEQIRGGTR